MENICPKCGGKMILFLGELYCLKCEYTIKQSIYTKSK